MKPGYSLLEVTIGILLASLLAVSLFQSVGSTTQTVQLADEVMDLDLRTAIFHHQFQKDTVGIFVPEKPGLSAGLSAGAPAQEEGPKPKQEVQEKKPSQPPKKIEFPKKLFYSTNKNNQLEQFTFITTNPVQVYSKVKNTQVSPRMVRIVYSLEPDPDHKGSFILYRQESDTLELDALKSKTIRSYELLGNIKSFALEFSYPVKKEPKKDDPKAAPSVATPIQIEKIVKQPDWPYATAKEAQEKKAPPYPQLITVKLTLWDDTFKDARSFIFSYPIASFTLLPKKQKRKKKVPARKKPGRPFGAGLKKETQDKFIQIGEHMVGALKNTRVRA